MKHESLIFCGALLMGGMLPLTSYAEDPIIRQIDGWALVFDPPDQVTTIILATDADHPAFGFMCPDSHARRYFASDPKWRQTSNDGKTAYITVDIECDGRTVESIPMYFEGDKSIMPATKAINPNVELKDQRIIDSDRNVLTSILTAKRYCTIYMSGLTLDIPLASVAKAISPYIDSCRRLGRW